jgi:hypothetical protein
MGKILEEITLMLQDWISMKNHIVFWVMALSSRICFYGHLMVS